MSCTEACKQVVLDLIADIEVTVTTAPPLIPSPWTQAFTCPHGVKFYLEPTSDQRATWARDGVA